VTSLSICCGFRNRECGAEGVLCGMRIADIWKSVFCGILLQVERSANYTWDFFRIPHFAKFK